MSDILSILCFRQTVNDLKKMEENQNYEAAPIAAVRGCLRLRHREGQIQ